MNDNSVGTMETEHETEVQTLSVHGKSGKVRAVPPRRRGSDYYDSILWRLRSEEQESSEAFMAGVLGCSTKSGATTVASNLAIRSADHRMGPVLLVDANEQRPALERAFKLYDAQGFADVLMGECDTADAVHSTSVEGLQVMPLGTRGLMGRASVDPAGMRSLLNELRQDYATVIFDLPEADRMRHGLLIARQLDATLLVLKSETIRRKAAATLRHRLQQDGLNVVGAVMTQHKTYAPNWLTR